MIPRELWALSVNSLAIASAIKTIEIVATVSMCLPFVLHAKSHDCGGFSTFLGFCLEQMRKIVRIVRTKLPKNRVKQCAPRQTKGAPKRTSTAFSLLGTPIAFLLGRGIGESPEPQNLLCVVRAAALTPDEVFYEYS